MNESLNDIVKKLPGYRIAASHFRIGSKIHINDFYYAKRFFQNSFFASRFAFLLAQKIYQDYASQIEQFRTEGLTLVGYGIYSELLLSLTEKFLKRLADLEDKKFNHNIILDSSDLDLAKASPIHPHVIIIVPIASTFSTSLKIEEQIKVNHKGKTVHDIHYNLLHVRGKEQCEKQKALEEEFGWVDPVKLKTELQGEPEKNTIYVKAFYSTEENEAPRRQRYFIQLPSEWQDMVACTNCWPLEQKNGKLNEEEPLFETDRTAVTPSLIFEFPKANHELKPCEAGSFNLSPDMLEYGHHMRDYSHFLYNINTEEFLEKNKTPVKEWLEVLKKQPAFNADLNELQNVLIVSSSHYSNASFINLVNETLFASSANVIHYDPSNDYIQNFDMIYGQEVYHAKKILFVDDSLKSGKTFAKIEGFIRHTLYMRMNRLKEKNKNQKIHACLFLLNQSQPYTYERVKQDLVPPGRIYTFANFHLFTSLSHDEESPITFEQEKYQNLEGHSILQSIKTYFSSYQEKLRKRHKITGITMRNERHLRMLEATHRVYSYFSLLEGSEFPKFNDFFDFVNTVTKKPLFLNRYKYIHQHNTRFTSMAACILKILTQTPFTQYKPIKEEVFPWVLNMLLGILDDVKKKIANHNFSIEMFQDLKFLLRRATLMNSNIIMSKEMFVALTALYSKNGLPALHKKLQFDYSKLGTSEAESTLYAEEARRARTSNKERLEKQIAAVENFTTYFTALIKELLYQNEARSIHLETTLKALKPTSVLALNRLFTILKIENAMVIQRFYEMLREQDDWKNLAINRVITTSVVGEIGDIIKILQLQKISSHNSYKILSKYFTETGQDSPTSNEAFLTFLWVKHFIEHEGDKKEKLEEKTQNLFKALNIICKFTEKSDENINRVGSFLIVHDLHQNAHLVHDANSSGNSEVNKYKWESPEHELLTGLLGPETKADPHFGETIIELKRENGEWIDSLVDTPNARVEKLGSNFLDEDLNRLILLRLVKRNGERIERKGLAGFYYNEQQSTPSDIFRMQYLLLLQDSLIRFIEKNHQINLFHEWLIAENNKRMLLLTSHGKEMLQTVSMEHQKKFGTIAHDLANLQAIILIKSEKDSAALKEKLQPFFDINYSTFITKEYGTQLKEMADLIFHSPAIENFVAMDAKDITAADFTFNVNRKLLDIICFELFVNAKKNRWHFMDDENIAGLTQNEVLISLKVETDAEGHRTLHLEISNSGPHVSRARDKRLMRNLNDEVHNVKRDDEASGTALIKVLITQVLNGKISFSTPDPAEEKPYLFTVDIQIPEHE